MTRVLWISMGLLSVLTGIIGIVLPLLPTTPFMLLAAFCFARSSPRLQDWIENHPTFGPIIESWRRHGSISPRAKRLALAMMAAALLLSLALHVPFWALIAQGLVMVGVAAFLLTRPNGPT